MSSQSFFLLVKQLKTVPTTGIMHTPNSVWLTHVSLVSATVNYCCIPSNMYALMILAVIVFVLDVLLTVLSIS